MKHVWTNRLDIAVRHTAQKRSTKSEKSLRLIETGADGLFPERYAGVGIGLNPTVFSKI